jgi:hypothetical protein
MKKQCVHCEVGTTLENIIRKQNYTVPVPGLSLLVAKSLSRRLGFYPGPVNEIFLVYKVKQRQNYFFVPVSGSFRYRTTMIFIITSPLLDEKIVETWE